MKLKFIKLDPNAIVPTRGSIEASGLDLYVLQDTVLAPNRTTQVKTGIGFDIPVGYEIQVRPRSGLSLKTAIRVANAPGSVDADFLGDVSALLWNTSSEEIIVKRGERVAQAVLCPVLIIDLEEATEFSRNSVRGANGFGSTGV